MFYLFLKFVGQSLPEIVFDTFTFIWEFRKIFDPNSKKSIIAFKFVSTA